MLAQMGSSGEDLLSARMQGRKSICPHFSVIFRGICCSAPPAAVSHRWSGISCCSPEAFGNTSGRSPEQEETPGCKQAAGENKKPTEESQFYAQCSPTPQTGQAKGSSNGKGAPEQKRALQTLQVSAARISGQNVETEGPTRKVLTIQEGKEKVINLDVIVGIPVRIINNDCVGCSKVYAQTTGAGREEKAELLSTRS